MSSHDSIHNHAMAVGAIVATAARLSGDILASILLRLPASDLHRFRRVCKEWRDVISNPIFIEAHQVGTCNGLLCFLDVGQSAINVVDPFTGESFALPLPPLTARRCELDAYSFGFNTNTRRCKIIHQGEGLYIAGKKVLLHVYMVGGGEKWRSLKVTGVEPGNSYGRPVCASGAVYWCVIETDGQCKFERFDLATEVVTTHFIHRSHQISLIDSDAWAFLTADTWLGVLKALFVREGDCLVYKYTLKLPHWRRPTESQALQRGHLLMQDFVDGELAGHDLGSGKLLLKKVNKKEEEEGDELAKNTDMTTGCNTRRLFVPILFNQEPSAIVTRVPQKKGRVRTFGYVPPVSPAPLAHCFGNLRGLHTI
ncbi:hypothetical protein ACQ4PT_033319 [Festuca glaucescens]